MVVCIVVTYNGSKWIRKCLSSLMQSTCPLKIIVIDNNSTDDTVRIIEQDFISVELFQLKRNIGFGQANNIGLRKAVHINATHVFLLNQDAWIVDNTIENLLGVSESHPEYGIISPMHWNAYGDGLERKFSEYINSFSTPHLISDFITGQQMKPIYQSHFVNAAGWFLPIRVIKHVGGFDPLFFQYGEDEDYTKRVLYHGFKVGIIPNSVIYHDSTFKSWDDIKFDKSRMLIIQFLKIKDLSRRLPSILLSFYKEQFNKLTDLLVYRKFSEFTFLFLTVIKASVHIVRINSSRLISKKKCAFLFDE